MRQARESGAQGFTRRAIENPEGFMGSDGLFRFNSAGGIERGLAVIEVGLDAVDACCTGVELLIEFGADAPVILCYVADYRVPSLASIPWRW